MNGDNIFDRKCTNLAPRNSNDHYFVEWSRNKEHNNSLKITTKKAFRSQLWREQDFFMPLRKRSRVPMAVGSHQKSAGLISPRHPKIVQGPATYNSRGGYKVYTGQTLYKCQEKDV